MTYTTDWLRAKLQAKGWRSSVQRELILQTFLGLSPGQHIGAEELRTLLERNGHDISEATIYRNLKLMVHMGILREIELNTHHRRYEIRGLNEDHHHLVCLETAQVIEFEHKGIQEIAEKIAQQHGFQVLDCQLTILGQKLRPEGRR